MNGVPDGRQEELARLIATLHDTQKRIIELTGGAIDGVLHSSGQHYLLRSAQEELHERAALEQRHATERMAILDALPAHVALLDRDGTIVAVNARWRAFAEASGWIGQDAGVGQDYLAVCDAPGDDATATDAATGIRAVLAGEEQSFTLEYPCHAPDRPQWFQMILTPVEGLEGGGAVVMHLDITARRVAEEDLNRASRLLHIAGRTARLGGWRVDLATGISEWSDEVCAIHEVPPGTRPTVDEGIRFYAPEWRERIREAFGACARDGTPFDEELEIVTASGTRKWVRAIGEAVRSDDSTVTSIHGAFQDMTPAKETEAALLLSERRFHQFAETLPQIVWTAEPDGALDFISSDFYGLTGLQRTERLARDWLDSLHPDDRRRCLQAWSEAVTGITDYRVEFRVWSAAEGIYRWHLVNAHPVRDAAGSVVKWYGAVIDIHDRHLAEEALAASQQRNRSILAAVGEGIHGIDPDGRIAFENPAARAILGYGEDELLGSEAHAFLHRHDPDGPHADDDSCPIRLTLRDGRARRVDDEVFLRKDGPAVPVEYICAPSTPTSRTRCRPSSSSTERGGCVTVRPRSYRRSITPPSTDYPSDPPSARAAPPPTGASRSS